jgi:hypothetical protein
MKLNFVSAHSKIGPMRKTIGLADGSSRSYPLAAKLTSYEAEIDVTEVGLEGYRALLVENAKYGRALYKGLFVRPLAHESRRNMTDPDARTEFLVLDVDGLRIEGELKKHYRPADVRNVAESVIEMLPDALHDVSYMAMASSSFGLNQDEVSVHIHFLLENPVSHRALKEWLTSLNYSQIEIHSRLKLTKTKTRLKSVIDPCLAEPARLIYIAPPSFGPKRQNPFANDDERFVIVEKDRKLLNLDPLLESIHDRMDAIISIRDAKIKELQQEAGIVRHKPKFTRINVDGHPVNVMSNPPSVRMEFAYEDDEFVRYNVGGSKNNAYWIARSNPEVVRCFVPDEPTFLFKSADPEAYAKHLEKYGEAYEEVKDEDGIVRKVQRSMFIDQTTDAYVTMEYDRDHDEIVEVNERRNSQVAEEWLKHYGQLVPDPVPAAHIILDPNRMETKFAIGDKDYINRFKPSMYMRDTSEHVYPETLTYGNAWMLSLECPVISEIILNMLGDDMDCFEHFINWLAFIMQKRDKTQTAWLVHGTEGTGKGLLFKAVLRPLIGQQYVAQNTLQGIADDQFNGWMEDVMLLMVDEFNMRGTSSLTKAASLLKTRITEPTMMIRKMQQQQREVVQRLNFIFATNDLDAMPVTDKRRYNIAPRQMRELEARLGYVKSHRESTDTLIKGELAKFATYLRSFTVDTHQSGSIIMNQARVETQKAGMSASDSFFAALRDGDFSVFIGILDKSAANLEPREFAQLTRVKTFLTANLEHVNTGKTCYLLPEDLRMLYSYLAGKEISENALSRMLATHDVNERKRKSRPVGSPKSLPSRPRCIGVCWAYDDKEILEAIREANCVVPSNVASIDPNKRTSEDFDRAMAEAQAELESSAEPDIYTNKGYDL